jgi:flagellar motility protein MotE (MotC chaperone)
MPASSDKFHAFVRAGFCIAAAGYLVLISGTAAAQNATLPWAPAIRIEEDPGTWNTKATAPTIINAPSVKATIKGNTQRKTLRAAASVPDTSTVTTGAIEKKTTAPSNVAVATTETQAAPGTTGDTNAEPAPATGQDATGDAAADQTKIPGRSLPQTYCDVVVDKALAAKLAQEKRDGQALQKEIEKRLTELQAATVEQKKWLQMREDFQKKATENLVTVYAEMDVEAAAQRLPAVGDEIASAILVKMPPRSASAILAEMPSDIAGRLTAYIAGAAELRPRPKEPDQKATQ